MWHFWCFKTNFIQIYKGVKTMETDQYAVQPDWPKEFEGYKVADLMQTIREIALTKEGTKADVKQIRAMDSFLEFVKFGVHDRAAPPSDVIEF